MLSKSAFIAVFVASLALSAPLAFASGASGNSPAQQSAMADSHSRAFNSFVPGASEQWCDSLAYPYCSTPAPGTPGSGPAPYVHPMPARPIFGGE